MKASLRKRIHPMAFISVARQVRLGAVLQTVRDYDEPVA